MIRGELDWIVLKAMEKDRARRYETVSKFAEDVQNFLNNQPVVACPPSNSYRIRKFAQRNRRALFATSIVTTAILVGFIGTSWQMLRALRAEQLATQRYEAAETARLNEAAQRREAQQQRKLANGRLQLALDQLTHFTDFVRQQEDLRRRNPVLQQNLLGQTAPLYARLIESMPEEDSVKDSFIAALIYLGNVHCMVGNHELAVRDYSRALKAIDNSKKQAIDTGYCRKLCLRSG